MEITKDKVTDYDISIPYSFASSDEETGEASKMGKIIYSDSKVPIYS